MTTGVRGKNRFGKEVVTEIPVDAPRAHQPGHKLRTSNEIIDRAELHKLEGQRLEYVREGDTMVITRLDRMARSVLDLTKIADRLQKKGVALRVLDQSIDTSTSEGKLMFHMLGAFAEFENDIRRERQMDGIAKVKQKESDNSGNKRL